MTAAYSNAHANISAAELLDQSNTIYRTLNETVVYIMPNHSIKFCTLAQLVPFEVNYLSIIARNVAPVIMSMIGVTGLIGNVLVILVVLCNKQMRTTTNILILSLAIADLAFIVFCVPSTALIYVTQSWPMGSFLCGAYYFTSYVSAYTSVYTLVLMSLDRFLAVVYPAESLEIRTPRNTTFASLTVWVVVLLLNIPLIFNTELDVKHDATKDCKVPICTYSWLTKKQGYTPPRIVFENRLFFIFFFFFGFFIPFVIICGLYAALIVRLRYGRTAKMAQSAEATCSKRRATRLVVVVIAVFGACWLPIQIVFLTQCIGFYKATETFLTIQVISNCLSYSNSGVNPILYAFLSENFRRGFARLLCFKKKGRRIVEIRNATTDYMAN